MGVPKFYRWISERYPCLSEVVRENQIPEFDNLYLDMNGVIHICSHPNDDDPHFRISEEKIFRDIFHYIEVLFRIVKPCKVFFMAVDGVAPRAKMNQQRGRRFRSARAAEEQEKKALQKGETLPTEKRFDSNCITPGTEFMAKLNEQLKYFVHKKVTEDKMWQGIRVYLSGHETPGEGEHKVMEFIRSEKAQPDYDPNTRHCLYGLDADLMMLGLTSHEPHFSLLREEVRFGGKKSQKRTPTPEETTFHLLHLSLFREYLEFEFQVLKNKLSFEFDLENIIDDWVLMGFLVGNDFIPHLPHLHINHDALPLLYRTYKEVLPTIDGYLNEGGTLNLKRFEAYLQRLSQFDRDKFSELSVDLRYFDAKKSSNGNDSWKGPRLKKKQEEAGLSQFSSPYAVLMNEDEAISRNDEISGGVGDLLASCKDDKEDDEEEIFEIEFRQHKRDYYRTKLGYEEVTEEVLKEQAIGYVTAIQWILHYYYNGVQSWSWFYPHHYAPYMSDVKGFSDCTVNYSLGEPFKPFQQLLAVLPAASKELLPAPYQSLMVMDNSPIIEYYPIDFKTDLNGKQQDWEAVVLIPFIDEERLLAAMLPITSSLTDEEKKRNHHGSHLLYTYDDNLTVNYPSSLPGIFPDITCSKANLEEVKLDAFRIDPKTMRKGLLTGAKEGVYYPGFPTMKHIPHSAKLKKCGVKVFQMNSRSDNMILTIEDKSDPDIDKVAKELLGKTVFAGWPHLQEVLVVGVADDQVRYELKGRNDMVTINQSDRDAANWVKEVQTITEHYMNRKGVEIGQVFVVLYVKPMTGRKYVCGANGMITLEKQWTVHPVPYALNTCVKDIAAYDPAFTQFKTLEELFPVKSVCFMLGTPHYGCMGEVMEVDRKGEPRIRVAFSTPQEPNLDQIARKLGRFQETYQPGYILAQRLGISSHLVSRITGTFFIFRGSRDEMGNNKVNVGLNLKFNKRNKEVPGFTRKEEDGNWTYSTKAQDVIAQYIQKFPKLFHHVAKNAQNDMFYEEDVFGPNSNNSSEISEWLKTLACYNVEQVQSGYKSLDENIVKAIMEDIDKLKECKQKRKLKMSVKPYLLFKPLKHQGHSLPDPNADFELYDRVVNVREGYSVPLGMKGVVVGIIAADRPADVVYDVIFDEEFVDAFLRSGKKRGYHIPAAAMINISYGVRKEAYQHGGMQKPMAVVKPQSTPDPSTHTPRYYADMVKSAGSSEPWRGVNSPRINHSPNSPFVPSQTYNKSKYNNMPRYSGPGSSDNKTQSNSQQQGGGRKGLLPTPNVGHGTHQQAPRQQSPRQQTNKQEQPPRILKRPSQENKVASGETTSEANEFANMWKQLQGSPQVAMTTAPSTPPTSTTLAMAAASLPIKTGQEERERLRQAQQTNKPVEETLRQAEQTNRTVEVGFESEQQNTKDLDSEFNQFLSQLQVSDDTDKDNSSNQTATKEVHQESTDRNERNSPGTIAKMKEGTEALCKLLHIGSPTDEDGGTKKVPESTGTKSFGKKLALADLFSEPGTMTTPVKNVPSSNVPMASPVQSGAVQQRGNMQGSMGNQQTGPPQNVVLELYHWCQSHRLPPPNYKCNQTPQGFLSTVQIGPHVFNGLASANQEQAYTSAAYIASITLQCQLNQSSRQPQQAPNRMPVPVSSPHGGVAIRGAPFPHYQQQLPGQKQSILGQPGQNFPHRAAFPNPQPQHPSNMSHNAQQKQDPRWQYLPQHGMRPQQHGMHPQQQGMSPQHYGLSPQQYGMSPQKPGLLPHPHGIQSQPHGMHPQHLGADNLQQHNVQMLQQAQGEMGQNRLQATANIFVPLQVSRNSTPIKGKSLDDKSDNFPLPDKTSESVDNIKETTVAKETSNSELKHSDGQSPMQTKKPTKNKPKAKLAINFSA